MNPLRTSDGNPLGTISHLLCDTSRRDTLGTPHGEEAGVEYVAGHPGVHPPEHAMRPRLKVWGPAGASKHIQPAHGA